MRRLPKLSGHDAVKILSKAGFKAVRQKGSHVIMIKQTPEGRAGVVVPLHKELKTGTLKAIIKKAGLTEGEFTDIFKK